MKTMFGLMPMRISLASRSSMRGQRRLAQYAQKLNVSIASDDLPDLMWVDAAQLKRMVEDDMLADLTDVYANYAAEFTNKVLTDDGGSAMEAATFGRKALRSAAYPVWLRLDGSPLGPCRLA